MNRITTNDEQMQLVQHILDSRAQSEVELAFTHATAVRARIDDLELSRDSMKCLEADDRYYIEDLPRLTSADMRRERGNAPLCEIWYALRWYGRRHAQATAEPPREPWDGDWVGDDHAAH